MNMRAQVRADGKLTVDEFLAFIESGPDDARWPLIDGVATMMPPPMVPHQVAKRRGHIRQRQNLYYLFVEQDETRAEFRARTAGWEPTELTGLTAMLELPEWGFRTPLSAL